MIVIAIGFSAGLFAKLLSGAGWLRFFIDSLIATVAAFLVAFSDALFGLSIATAWGTLVGMVAAALLAVSILRLIRAQA